MIEIHPNERSNRVAPAKPKLKEASALPIIDISPLGLPEEQQLTIQRLGMAAETRGYFYIRNHGIPLLLFDDLAATARSLFSMPLSEKMKSYIGEPHRHRGYVPPFSADETHDEVRHPLCEAYDLARDLASAPSHSRMSAAFSERNPWPSIRNFALISRRYFEAANRLSEQLSDAFATYLQVDPATFHTAMADPNSKLRLLHYLPDEELYGDFPPMKRQASDTCFTLLYTQNDGLQILDREGDWLRIPALEHCLVVIVGDALEAWTHGRFKSPLYRVSPDGRERYVFSYIQQAACQKSSPILDPLAQLPGGMTVLPLTTLL